MSRQSLGHFELLVMLALLRQGEEAYGVPIRQEIAACTDRNPSPGALYTTLERLEEKGLVRSRFGDPTPERGGRAKRYFTLTTRGGQALARAQQSYQRLLEGVTLPRVARA